MFTINGKRKGRLFQYCFLTQTLKCLFYMLVQEPTHLTKNCSKLAKKEIGKGVNLVQS